MHNSGSGGDESQQTSHDSTTDVESETDHELNLSSSSSTHEVMRCPEVFKELGLRSSNFAKNSHLEGSPAKPSNLSLITHSPPTIAACVVLTAIIVIFLVKGWLSGNCRYP